MKLTEVVAPTNSKNGLKNASGIRIVLVDDHELLRAGINSLVSATDGFRVVAEARDKAQAVACVEREQPDVILLNIDLKSGDGLEMVPDLLAACKTSRLAVLTDSHDPDIHRRAILFGATGVISEDEPPAILLKAIARVHAGSAWLDRSIAASLIGELLTPNKGQKARSEAKGIATLSERELEVIRLVGWGLRNKQIAERLFISDITVHHHLTSIYSKLEVRDRFELLIYAYRHRLAELPR